MLRFIIKRTIRDANDSYSSDTFETIDVELPQIEEILNRGGYGEMGFDRSELAGVEIVNP
jgi:hypothetical protein